jgi:hypothetical protein
MTLQLLKEKVLQQVAQVDNEWQLVRLKQLLAAFAQENAPNRTDVALQDKVLMSKINQTALPIVLVERCNALLLKQEFSSITELEHRELMALITQEEELRVQRAKYLIELAQLRNISLQQLMLKLG